MTFEIPARETLRLLFSLYLKGPTGIYPINNVAKKYKVDALALSDHLLENEWIRERWIYTENIVACKITIRGIEEIEPVYVRNKLNQLIGGLGKAGGSKDLLEILEFKLDEYSIALDLVRQLQSLGLVRMQHLQSRIVIELTSEGWHCFESGSRTFFTLMMMA